MCLAQPTCRVEPAAEERTGRRDGDLNVLRNVTFLNYDIFILKYLQLWHKMAQGVLRNVTIILIEIFTTMTKNGTWCFEKCHIYFVWNIYNYDMKWHKVFWEMSHLFCLKYLQLWHKVAQGVLRNVTFFYLYNYDIKWHLVFWEMSDLF